MTHAHRTLRHSCNAAAAMMLALSAACPSVLSAQPRTGPDTPNDIHGAWRMHDGGVVALYQSSPNDSGWRFVDFRSGASHQLSRRDAGSFASSDAWSGTTPARITYTVSRNSDRNAARLTVARAGAPVRRGTRIAIREETVSFSSGDVTLSGKIFFPGTGPGPWPVVIYVHGSDNTPSVDRVWEPYLMASSGVAMFVFDKRGTGRSGGTYTQMFSTLADDVVAATQFLRTRQGVDTTRIGLAGFSQGGWVAPLAASKDHGIRFVLVGYGMTMSIAEEDQLEAPLKLRERGFTDRDIGEFQELNGAIHRAAASRFADGWTDVEAAAAKYRDRPWMKALGEMQTWASMMLGMGLDRAKVAMPDMLRSFIDPFYNSIPTLATLNIPILWLIAGDDIEAPPGPTISALAKLRADGRNIETRIFPHSDHGMTEFTVQGGRRTPTRYAPEYAPTMIHWIRERVRLKR
jgi:uncharacterized protein